MTTPTAKDAAAIIGSVGEMVGKTKLQKTAALLELAGLGAGFTFNYHLYGPYSEELAAAVDRAVLLGLIREDERVANWGGRYSVFESDSGPLQDQQAVELVKRANRADSVVLELAVTAGFLAAAREDHAWEKVCELKPEKATPANLRRAKELYEDFRAIKPDQLPNI